MRREYGCDETVLGGANRGQGHALARDHRHPAYVVLLATDLEAAKDIYQTQTKMSLAVAPEAEKRRT
jgi:hypothetical protein